MSEKIDFLISPAYSVPPITTSPRVGWSTTKVSERVPSASGSASTSGAWSTSASGTWSASSSSVGSMKSVFAKSACQGEYVITRTPSRCAGSAPAKASIT